MGAERIGVVWNPSKIRREKLQAGVESALGGDTAEIGWFETAKDDPGRAATQGALDAGCTLVFAAGGDGTVRAVAEHLAEAETDAALGIIPLGTGNLLARNLEVPLNSISAAVRRAREGTARPIDVAWAEVDTAEGTERYGFVVMAGFGIDAHMITETDDDLKSRAGWLAYVESLGRAVTASSLIGLRFTAPGREPVRTEAHTVIVGNCGMLQGGIALLPDASPSDGELDLLVLSADGIVGWMDTLRNMAWDNGLLRLLGGGQTTLQSSETAVHRRLRTVTIELDEPREFEVDGDAVGEATRIVFSVQPAGVHVRY